MQPKKHLLESSPACVLGQRLDRAVRRNRYEAKEHQYKRERPWKYAPGSGILHIYTMDIVLNGKQIISRVSCRSWTG
jgi:hypothetical protein